MTVNQYNYAQLAQVARRDAETARHYRAQEYQAAQDLAEGRRHSLATEQLEAQRIAEAVRHNTMAEKIDTSKVAETVRHNFVGESIDRFSADTSANLGSRNADTQSERVRNDFLLGNENVAISQQSANAQSYNARTNRLNMYVNAFNAVGNQINNAFNTTIKGIQSVPGIIGGII